MGTGSVAAGLEQRLTDVTLRDEARLRRRLQGARRIADPTRRARALDEVAAAVETAASRVARRRAGVPPLTYPDELPVSQRRDDIAAAIRDHQVVVVAGETGSGKTTQLPKICLELGRGVRGTIGHTQPRRLAARAVAERLAEELDVPLGTAVGYQVRFTDLAGPDSLVKVMTDGILLAEIQRDRDLLAYDTIVLDEAHERSLTIDFLLGYLARLLPRRPDLKLVITSATIDPERFARHFGGAPVVEVSGRTYPVEVRYRPVVDDTDPDRDQTQAILDAVDELSAEGPGDILVFLSGEREIRDTAEALAGRDAEILPLYARLSAAEQHRVFAPHRGRRIVLATNVAETSLTVPGIRYVVDPGTARISRYSSRLKVQRLPIEPISQASADQRKGRCGRVAEGVCIRLYSEEDFAGRPRYTDPEILRTNLASVILQMAALGLGDLADFPFVDPPDRRHVRDGLALLHELGALDPHQPDPRRQLTPLGRSLAQLPADPRLARMVVEGDRNGCLREVLVIAAGLSIQDPRERPADKQEAAAQAHARFTEHRSDFLAYVELWDYLREQQKTLSGNAFRRLCRAEFLHYLRVREWQDVYAQLRQVAAGLGMRLNTTPADPDRVHQSLLAGLLSHVGLREGETREYAGARGARFAIAPGSVLSRKPPRWVVVGELVETSRLWGRVAARIEPEWAERLAGHLVKRTYSEPHWDRRRAAVMAYERVTLYGVPLVASRAVTYGRIDPVASRELFLRHALVEGDWDAPHRFLAENRRRLDDVAALEDRLRRRDLQPDDEVLVDFFDARVPADVVSGRHFDQWWKVARRTTPDLLTYPPELLLPAGVDVSGFPDVWEHAGLRLPLAYRFDPTAGDDGVTVQVLLPLLDRVEQARLDWQVPGLRHDLVTALIRSLPKDLRRAFVPAPDVAATVLARLAPLAEPLLDALERELRRLTGVVVPRTAWAFDRVPPHLRVTYRVVDETGRSLATGKDVGGLRTRLAEELRALVASAAEGLERSGLRGWTFGDLPGTVDVRSAGHVVRGYPALVDEGSSVGVRVLCTESEQAYAMARGTRRLLLLGVPSPVKPLLGRLDNRTKLALAHNPHGSVPALLDDCLAATLDRLVAEHGGPAWDPESFGKLLGAVRAGLVDALAGVVTGVARVLATAQEVDLRLAATTSPVLAAAVADVRAQLARLVFPGFVTATGSRRLRDVERYLRAMLVRLDRLPDNPRRDAESMAVVRDLEARYRDLVDGLPPARRAAEPVVAVRWMLEELRVGLFAQRLGTAYPVSEQRVLRALAAW